MILVSACLAGINCAWDGKNRLNKEIKRLVDNKLAIPLCPEVLGGRDIPRTKAEIKSGSGEDVLDGKAKVFDENGKDLTDEFLKGAYLVLLDAKKHSIKKAGLPGCRIRG